MDTSNLEIRTKRHVLCEMNNTTAPISSRYRAREKNLGNSQEDKITLYADEQSEIDKENLESQRSREVLYSEPPYIANVRAHVTDQKLEKDLKNQDQVSDPKKLGRLGSDSKADSFIPIRKEVGTTKKTDKKVGNSSSVPLHYIPPRRLGEKCSPPIGNKISRPPNAFMIFAKEQRHKIKEENPSETNRQVSIILGTLWRKLSGEEKAKYFLTANELEKQHKEKYPDYIYCPTEARKQKQTRLLKKQKTNILYVKENSNESSDKKECPKIPEKQIKQEVKAQTPIIKLEKSEKGISTTATYKEKYGFPSPCFSPMSTSPMDSPIYWPYPSEWMSPFHNPTGPYCNCQHKECDTTARPSNSGYQQHVSRQPGPCSQSNTFSYPQMFHPAVMNPWMMFPTPFCAFNGPPGVRDMHNSFMNNHHKYACLQPYLEKNAEKKPASPSECCVSKDPLKEIRDPRKVKEAKDSPKVKKVIDSTKVEKVIDSPKKKKGVDSNKRKEGAGSPKIKEDVDTLKIKEDIESSKIKEKIESSKTKKDKDDPKEKEADSFEHEIDSDSHHSLIIADETLELEDIIMEVREKVKGKRGLEE